MSKLTVHIPTLETERLILRAPTLQDAESFIAFKTSERSKFTNGPLDRAAAQVSFSAIAGMWVFRGYGLFMAALKTEPEIAIGGFGIFHPAKHEEPEFGWSLYDARYEGKGYVTEAMRAVIPWAWDVIGVDTAQSHIDEGNAASAAVAIALGASLDADATKTANAPGGEFEDEAPFVNIYRHTKGALK